MTGVKIPIPVQCQFGDVSLAAITQNIDITPTESFSSESPAEFDIAMNVVFRCGSDEMHVLQKAAASPCSRRMIVGNQSQVISCIVKASESRGRLYDANNIEIHNVQQSDLVSGVVVHIKKRTETTDWPEGVDVIQWVETHPAPLRFEGRR